MSDKRVLEIVGKRLYIQRGLLEGLNEEVHRWIKAYHRPPHAIVLGPSEYLTLCMQYQSETGQFPPATTQLLFMNIPVMASQKAGWSFIIPTNLLPLLVPGLINGGKGLPEGEPKQDQ